MNGRPFVPQGPFQHRLPDFPFPGRAQRMDGQAGAVEGSVDKPLLHHAGDFFKKFRVAAKPFLRRAQRLAIEAALIIENRQQGHGDARRLGGARDAQRGFRRLAIAPAIGPVMQIVKLRDRGIALAQHLGIKLGGDRLHIVRADLRDQPVHGLAPGPEAVILAAGPFGQSRHGALKGVGMQVGHAGDDDLRIIVAGGLCVRFDLQDAAIHRIVMDQHVSRPAVGQQGLLREQCFDRRHRHISPPLTHA